MKKLPCYIENGGYHDVLNVPMSLPMRASLVQLCRRLIASQAKLDTIMAAEYRPQFLSVSKALVQILTADFRRKANRRAVVDCYAAHEKNLKSETARDCDDFDIFQFAIAVGLVGSIFLFASLIPDPFIY